MRNQTLPMLFGREVRAIHCVGIGGMGVAPLAIYLAQSGFVVSGEDDALTEEVRALLLRERVTISSIPSDCGLVVYSSAIAKTHDAYLAACARNLPLVRRGEMLAEMVRGKKLVAVCGSHGKTTTTALLVTAARRANFPAGFLLGGLFGDESAPARVGSNDWVIAEIDESDGTIEKFAPTLTVTVNLDWDHPDQYRQQADLERAFAALFARTTMTVLVSDACPLSGRVVNQVAASDRAGVTLPSFETFGRSGSYSATISSDVAGKMTLKLGGRFKLDEAIVRTSGEFNASNATAALAAAQMMGMELQARLLADFPGVRRRQATLYAEEGITVMEDYAHHPSEIRALLGTLRRRVEGAGRLIVVFQPHRYTRTVQFKAEFAAALATADRLHLLDVYSAGEAPIQGGTTADIYAELKRTAPTLMVNYLPGSDADVFASLAREVRGGDLVAFVGAGNIDRQARDWLTVLRGKAMETRVWDEFAAGLKTVLDDGTKLKREEPLGPRTTLRVGGAARVYVEPKTPHELQAVLRAAKTQGVEVFLLGRGSNLIIPDEGVEGVVISLAHESWAAFEPREDGRVWVGAGLRLKNLCGLATKAGLIGFEFLEGIPGSVGGALRMNAGAMGGWMFDVVEQVQLMTLSGEVKMIERANMHVNYRHCAELYHTIALGALLRPVAKSDALAVSRQIDVYRRKRQESQPREPSAGCIFKNPPGSSAGRLIDESGLKGERIGDAEVSPVHANFIINRGHATGSDVLALVRRVRARVLEVKGVELEPEVLLYGKSWKSVL
jgi:UDP-N-acetylmuramate--alanine ligase